MERASDCSWGSALLLATSPPGGLAGASVRAEITLEALHGRFSRVDVVSMGAPGDAGRVADGTHLVPWGSPPPRSAYAAGLLTGGSPFVQIRASGLSRRVHELRERGRISPRPDLVWCHFLLTAPAGLKVPASARVLDADFAAAAAARRWLQESNAVGRSRLYLRLDAAAITRRERQLCGMFDQLVVVSDSERQRLAHIRRPTTVVPNAVADEQFPQTASAERAGLLFVGSLDYGANVDAVAFFVREVLPLVRSRVPTAELTVVGRNPAQEVTVLARAPGVRLVADAPSLEPFYARARAVVAPLRSGGGTRIKVLEAMVRSLAIVATPTAVDGLRLEHGVAALVASQPAALAEHCVTVLSDAALAQRLGAAARSAWSRDHRPELARERLERVLDAVLTATRVGSR